MLKYRNFFLRYRIKNKKSPGVKISGLGKKSQDKNPSEPESAKFCSRAHVIYFQQDVVQLERFYSRRNRYVLVANFGNSAESLQTIGRIYTGGHLVLDTSNSMPELNSDVLFKQMVLPPGQAVVIKIPK